MYSGLLDDPECALTYAKGKQGFTFCFWFLSRHEKLVFSFIVMLL